MLLWLWVLVLFPILQQEKRTISVVSVLVPEHQAECVLCGGTLHQIQRLHVNLYLHTLYQRYEFLCPFMSFSTFLIHLQTLLNFLEICQCCSIALRWQAAGEQILLVFLISSIVYQGQIALILPFLLHVPFSFGRKQFLYTERLWIKVFHWLEISLFCFGMFMFFHFSITNFQISFFFTPRFLPLTRVRYTIKVSHLQYHHDHQTYVEIGQLETWLLIHVTMLKHECMILTSY